MSGKQKVFVVVGFVVAAVAVLAWGVVMQPSRGTPVRVGETVFHARVAHTESEREEGLSGSSPLGDEDAMLFVFPSDGKWGIWMKDMNYPIDILWLDSDKRVVHIVRDAQPSSYPEVTYMPDKPARYVLETKSGTVEHKRITIGTRVEFDPTQGEFK
jgi:uncharacterized protein